MGDKLCSHNLLPMDVEQKKKWLLGDTLWLRFLGSQAFRWNSYLPPITVSWGKESPPTILLWKALIYWEVGKSTHLCTSSQKGPVKRLKSGMWNFYVRFFEVQNFAPCLSLPLEQSGSKNFCFAFRKLTSASRLLLWLLHFYHLWKAFLSPWS